MAEYIVVVDDEQITLKQMRRLLEKDGYSVSTFSNPVRALQYIDDHECHLVISDIRMPSMDGLELMTKIKARAPETEVILITGYASLAAAVEATKEGAFSYLEKPFTPDQVRTVVKKAFAQRNMRRKAKELSAHKGRQRAEPVIIGESKRIREVVSIIQQIAPTDCNVLITGDSGSGKELVARSIHTRSKREKGPFMAFNCAALNDTLLENELFGHEKGAFTSAESTSSGLLESANGGTLFLDEIGEMPQTMQVKLLRVLQERELLRVGGHVPIPIDVRIVSATSIDIKTMVTEGIFRKDLFYRINVVNIKLPQLNERKEDIPLLAYHILNRLNRQEKRGITAISHNALKLLMDYAFPGNVRELENILERAVALCQGNIIRVCDLPPDLIELETQAYSLPEHHMMTLAELEQDYITHLLGITGGVRTKTAEILGIDRASLWRKMKKYGLE